jgi:1,2-diacylglycerol 3-beta-galactosyltransferase
VVAALKYWLDYPKQREIVAAACKKLARPDAARKIARLIAEKVGVS